MYATRRLVLTAFAAIAALPSLSLAADLVPVPGAPGELRGQVVRKDGKPVTSFAVNGIRFEDPTGSFKILVPPEGHFRVVIRAPGFAPNFIQVEGAAGKKLMLPEIALGQGEKLVGEVVDAVTGMPVPEASVSLADPARIERLRFVRPERLADVARTGIGGFYLLDRAPRGLLLLVVRHPDYLPEFVPVNTREQPQAVALHKPGSLSGTVRNAGGELAAGVRIVVLSGSAYDGGETVTDSFGRWSLKNLRPGKYEVHALAGALSTTRPEQVEVHDGTTRSVRLSLGDAPSPSGSSAGLIASAPTR